MEADNVMNPNETWQPHRQTFDSTLEYDSKRQNLQDYVSNINSVLSNCISAQQITRSQPTTIVTHVSYGQGSTSYYWGMTLLQLFR
jgi:oligoendopeptidase F